MITLKLSKSYMIPTRWDDFSPQYGKNFMEMCRAFELFETGEIDYGTVRIAVAAALAGIDMRKVRRKAWTDTWTGIRPSSARPGKARIGDDGQVLMENLFRISEHTSFPFNMSEDGKSVSLKIILRCNLFPEAGGCKGYRFHVAADGMADCSVTAEQYVECLPLVELYTKERSANALDSLFRILYGTGKKAEQDCKVAVYYNFRGILEWIRLLPGFRMLFERQSGKKQGTSPLGLSSSIFSLSKAGYGTLEEIRRLDLFSYLGALVQQDIDGIRSLQSAGLKPSAIAEKMNMPLGHVLPYIVETDNND